MTNEERLTLVNQFEILKCLKPEESRYYEKKIEILEEGYTYHYDEIFGNLSPEMSKEDSRFVLDLLNMYRDINFSKSNYTKAQLSEIKDLSTQYRGFDYNDDYEATLGFYAKFFIKELGRFQELIEDEDFDGFNSHWLMLNSYKEYLSNYGELKDLENIEFGKMTPGHLRKILG